MSNPTTRPAPRNPRVAIGGERPAVNREADRLVTHLIRHPNDESARAALLEAWERLGVATTR